MTDKELICTECGKDETETTFYKTLSGYRQPCSNCLNLAARVKRAKGRAFDREKFDQEGNYWNDKTIELMKLMLPTKL